jgi:hypothetical protein
MAEAAHETVREAVGVFHDRTSLKNAVEDLMSAGFDRAELSLLASAAAVEEKLPGVYRKIEELEDDPSVPRAAYAGDHSLAEGRTGMIGGLAYIGAMVGAAATVASGGALAAAIAAAAVGGGGAGLIGGLAARYLGRDRAQALQRQLDQGGLLLWVRVRDPGRERRALDILTETGANDVHVHDLPVSGDPAANPLSGLKIDPFLPGSQL